MPRTTWVDDRKNKISHKNLKSVMILAVVVWIRMNKIWERRRRRRRRRGV
jgi:hypothetical protein